MSISDYTKDMLESVSIDIFVNNSNIVDIAEYDICWWKIIYITVIFWLV